MSEDTRPTVPLDVPTHPRQWDVLGSEELPKGTRVIYLGCNGYEWERAKAFSLGLLVNSVYTIDYVHVGAEKTKLTLQEFPGETFNSVLFAHEHTIEERLAKRVMEATQLAKFLPALAAAWDKTNEGLNLPIACGVSAILHSAAACVEKLHGKK